MGARGCGTCPWILWPVRVALFWVLGVADPGTFAAVREAGLEMHAAGTASRLGDGPDRGQRALPAGAALARARFTPCRPGLTRAESQQGTWRYASWEDSAAFALSFWIADRKTIH